MNLDKLQTLDRIVMDRESYEHMAKWYLSLEEHPASLDIPFYEGLLIMKADDMSMSEIETYMKENEQKGLVKNANKKAVSDLYEQRLEKEMHTYFNFKDDATFSCMQLEYTKKTNAYDPIITFSCDLKTFVSTKKFNVTNHLKNMKLPEVELQRLAFLAFDVVMRSLHFISNYEKPLDITEHRIIKVKKGKAKGGKPGKKKVIRIGVKTYQFPKPSDDSSASYQRHAESWRVRGHWRYYPKTGKRVWIAPYTKGEGNIEGKEYKL